MAELPPNPLPALPDPSYDGGLSPYANSPLRDVCGTRINPDAIAWYKRREAMTSEQCGVKSAAHPHMEAWLANVRSFDARMTVRQPPLSEWPLSKIIAQIQIWGTKLPYPLPEGITCLVNYDDLAPNPSTPPRNDRAINIRERFDDSSELLLGFFGDHRYNMGLWPQESFWHEPFLDNFTGIVVPGFSAFSDDPVPQSLLGERMLQMFAEEGYYAGRNVIPQIAWRSEESLRRQVELLASLYPRVNTVLVDCYGMHVDSVKWAMRWMFAIRKYLKDLPFRFLIAGMTSYWMIEKLNEIFPDGNYCLIASAAMHRRAMAAAANPDIMASRFSQQVRRLQDYCGGRQTGNSIDWPDEWPTFSQARIEPPK